MLEITITGSRNEGKTTLAIMIAKLLLNEGHSVRVVHPNIPFPNPMDDPDQLGAFRIANLHKKTEVTIIDTHVSGY